MNVPLLNINCLFLGLVTKSSTNGGQQQYNQQQQHWPIRQRRLLPFVVLELNVFVAFITFPPGFLCFDSKTRTTKVSQVGRPPPEKCSWQQQLVVVRSPLPLSSLLLHTENSLNQQKFRCCHHLTRRPQQHSLETKHTPSSFPCAIQGFAKKIVLLLEHKFRKVCMHKKIIQI